MSAKPSNERRRGRRISLAFHVEISGVGVNGVPYCDQASACDVSDRGCQVSLTREIQVGDLLTLRVVRKGKPQADPDTPFLYQAVWVVPNDNGGGWLAGLAALEPGNPWRMNFPHESLVRN